MAKTVRAFDRWKPHDETTWAFQVYRKYNRELYQIIEAHRASKFYTYSQLKKNKQSLSSPVTQVFAGSPTGIKNFSDLKDWSNGFNKFDEWVNLSNITTISSNIETYLVSVIKIAIISNPSVLIGAPWRSIDGAYVIKHGNGLQTNISEHVISCTKGDWSSRLAAIERLFGKLPAPIRSYHADLEKIRNLRNRFGHAFGRDIEESRKHGQLEIAPMDKVSEKAVAKLGTSAWRFVQAMDDLLIKNHIGEFEAINYYANLYPTQNKDVAPSQRAINFKKSIGQFGSGLRSKNYCKELVNYWEAL